MIGGKYTNDKSLGEGGLRGGGVDMVLDGGAETGIGIKSTALRKNNQQAMSQIVGVGAKRSKESQLK